MKFLKVGPTITSAPACLIVLELFMIKILRRFYVVHRIPANNLLVAMPEVVPYLWHVLEKDDDSKQA